MMTAARTIKGISFVEALLYDVVAFPQSVQFTAEMLRKYSASAAERFLYLE